MFLWSTLKKTWSQLLQLSHDGRRGILELLGREYLEEEKTAAQYRRHAERMQYPQFREKLLRIAGEEQKHAAWLKQRIRALGGEVPRVSFDLEDGWNSWERLRLDLAEERRCLWGLEESLMKIDPIDPETAEGLRHILEEEKEHRDAILDMLMRSDPQAIQPI